MENFNTQLNDPLAERMAQVQTRGYCKEHDIHDPEKKAEVLAAMRKAASKLRK